MCYKQWKDSGLLGNIRLYLNISSAIFLPFKLIFFKCLCMCGLGEGQNLKSQWSILENGSKYKGTQKCAEILISSV